MGLRTRPGQVMEDRSVRSMFRALMTMKGGPSYSSIADIVQIGWAGSKCRCGFALPVKSVGCVCRVAIQRPAVRQKENLKRHEGGLLESRPCRPSHTHSDDPPARRMGRPVLPPLTDCPRPATATSCGLVFTPQEGYSLECLQPTPARPVSVPRRANVSMY